MYNALKNEEIDDELLEKVSNRIKKWFDNEPVDNKKYLKTKTKYYDGKINRNIYLSVYNIVWFYNIVCSIIIV